MTLLASKALRMETMPHEDHQSMWRLEEILQGDVNTYKTGGGTYEFRLYSVFLFFF